MTTIKIKPETQKRLRDFADGIGGQYDGVLNFILDQIRKSEETDVLAGVRLRDLYQTTKASKSDDTQ